MKKYDIAIIGAGAAGFAAAMRAMDFNKHICLIEKNTAGGMGGIFGALVSKTLWHLSIDYSIATRTDRGYRTSNISLDFKEVIKTVRTAAKEKIFQIKSQIESFSPGKFPDKSITFKNGTAKFIDNHTLEITNKTGAKEIIKAEYIIIATGSRPREYPGIEIDRKHIITSDDILRLEKFPEKLIIIGSGIIGTEYATIFSNFKQTEVHLLDRQHRVIPFEDDDVSDFVAKNLENNGVIIHYTANLRHLQKTSENNLEVILDYKDGHSQVIETDAALISIGRVPNTDNLNLEKVGIYPDKRGYLPINDKFMVKSQYGYKNIYAAGDVTGTSQLYSIGEQQGRFVIRAIYDQISYPFSIYNLPTLMFFKPELAAVGLNEKQLRERKIPYKMVFYSNKLINRAIAMRNTNGFIKILASNDGEERILGMRAAGPQASAFIVSIAHMINQKNSIDQILRTIHPHPSITEGIQDCLRVMKNKSLYKTYAFPHLIKTYEWSPN